MMPVFQRDLNGPAAVRALLHWIRVRTPIVKIADYRYMLRIRRQIHEVCGPEIVLCRVPIWPTEIIRTNVKHPTTYQLTCYDPSLASENLNGAWERVKKAESVP